MSSVLAYVRSVDVLRIDTLSVAILLDTSLSELLRSEVVLLGDCLSASLFVTSKVETLRERNLSAVLLLTSRSDDLEFRSGEVLEAVRLLREADNVLLSAET